MRPTVKVLARWSPRALLGRILRGPVPFEVASESTEKLRAASETWQSHIKSCILRHPDDPYTGLLAHALGSEDEAQRVREQQGYTLGPIPGVLSLHFLRQETEWRNLPPQKLWPHFQTIAWALHDEVNRVAYDGKLPGRGKLLYVLTRGQEFADGDAGGLCLGKPADGQEFRPFAVIGVTREWHASYEALKETLLHELAHWAAYHHCGHWQHLGQSEVATSGHGDYWLREVRRIQGVFGDFVGFRFSPGHEGSAAGDMGMYMHAYVCGACGQRWRYASRSSERQRRCIGCGTTAMAYIGQFDALSQPYASKRNAAWCAYVADCFPAVFARLASQLSQGSVVDSPDVSLTVGAAESATSQTLVLSESDAARVREQVHHSCCARQQVEGCLIQALQELTRTFSGPREAACHADVSPPRESTEALETVPWHMLQPSRAGTTCSSMGVVDGDAYTRPRTQHTPPQVQSSKSVDDIASSLDAALKAEVLAAGGPTSRRFTALRDSTANPRAVVRRSVAGSPRFFESAGSDPVRARRPSLQQRQWYLFQRAAWAEAQREVAAGMKKSKPGASQGGFKSDSTGEVQRLVASWWHKHKKEMVSEAYKVELCGDDASERGAAAVNGAAHPSASSAVRESGCDMAASSIARQNADGGRTASSAVVTQAGAHDNDMNSNEGTRGAITANSSGGKVDSKCISVGEAEQYARIAHHVWKRFGVRAWEAGVTNDEARALYRAWS